jgi:hypothetical protein
LQSSPRPFSALVGALVFACALVLCANSGYARRASADDATTGAATTPPATQPATQPSTQPVQIGNANAPTTRPLRRRSAPQHIAESRPGTAVPGLAAQEAGVARVRDIFSIDYRDTAYNARRALAKKLIDQGDQTIRDTDAKYILYREARDVAAGAGDVPTAFEAIDRMAAAFPIVKLRERIGALKVAAPLLVAPAANEAVVSMCIDLVDQSVVEDDFDPAEALLDVAADAATRTPKRLYGSWVTWKRARVRQRRAAYEQAKPAADKLKSWPEDPDANTIMGDYICVVRKDWDTGLPMIAKGSDRAFAMLVEKDLQCPEDQSREQYNMAEAWWAWAEHTHDTARQAGYLTRAAHWYARALPELDGLDKATAQRRILIAYPPPSPATRIPRPPDAMPFKGHLYRVSIAEVSWDAARRLCEDAGGRLLCLETRYENDYVVKLTKGRVVWLGGSFDARRRWAWLSGTDMFFTSWGQNEPNTSDTVLRPQMGTNGSWITSVQRTGFVCEWDN